MLSFDDRTHFYAKKKLFTYVSEHCLGRKGGYAEIVAQKIHFTSTSLLFGDFFDSFHKCPQLRMPSIVDSRPVLHYFLSLLIQKRKTKSQNILYTNSVQT